MRDCAQIETYQLLRASLNLSGLRNYFTFCISAAIFSAAAHDLHDDELQLPHALFAFSWLFPELLFPQPPEQWSPQSQRPRLTILYMASAASASISTSSTMVEGVITNSCTFFLRFRYRLPLRLMPSAYAAAPSAFERASSFFFSLYFGIGRNSWNSIAAAMTMAITVQKLNATSPVERPPN